jgi:hypothetical protein
VHHERYPVVVLVGGGVGITPQIAALKDIYRIRMTVVARVEHARRSHIKHVYFVWVCPDMVRPVRRAVVMCALLGHCELVH